MMEHVPDDHVTATFSRPADDKPMRPFDVPERFTLVKPLGRGGQGSVWLAEDRTLNQSIALKVINLEARERTVQEARMGRDLDHPHLLRIFDLVEQPDRLILVMEWLQGGSVKGMLHDGPLPITEVVAIADQVLEALAYLHDRGIVHRDVKPSNLLRERTGRIKLGDLGLVRELERSADMTRSGLAIGTPDYMSPEQLKGETPAPPADLYALGVTLYELLCGAKPFAGSSDLAIANHHLGSSIPRVRARRPDCPRWLAAFVARLLEKKPHDRWQDGGAALAALRRRRAPRWRLWRRGAVAVAAATAVGITGWFAYDRLRPQVAGAVVEGNQVIGIDAEGGVLWRRTFEHRVAATLTADLTASPGMEVAVGLNVIDPDSGLRRAAISVLAADGGEVDRFSIDPGPLQRWYPDLSVDLQVSPKLAGDLDGDGRDDLIWSANHPAWYPTMIGVWWGHTGRTVQPLMINSGRIFSVAIGDADGDGRPELVAAGLNNPAGYQSIVAVVEIGRTLMSPDLLPHDLDRIQHTYFALGSHTGRPSIESIGSNTIDLQMPAGPLTLRIDDSSKTSGNIAERTDRREFWQQVIALCRDATAQPTIATGELHKLQRTFPSILEEQGSRLAVDLLLARSLARAGDHQGAISQLRETTRRNPELIDPWLRLGEYLLIVGDREAGRKAIRRSMVARTAGRNPYDAIVFLTLDAALHGSQPDLEEARRFWKSYTGMGDWTLQYRPLENLATFFRGRWSDLDPGFGAGGYYRPVAVIEPWAQLERGADPVAVFDEASLIAANPEVTQQAHVLQALALLRLGRTAEAKTLANDALQNLLSRGREHYEHFIWVPAAEWVYAKTLEASGDRRAADEHYARAARIAPNAWIAESARTSSARQ